MKRMWIKSSCLCLFLGIIFCFVGNLQGADGNEAGEGSLPEKPARLTLVKAIMCEGIEDLEPFDETIIFSAGLGKVICFTAFDPVPEKTVIYHHWFNRDQPDKEVKLTLKPPKWSSFSQTSVRNVDVGPWRVEIVDADGKILKILRFSVTE
ncbi:MAG: DUF2914 domain-containing protein [Deltaproteobacteria bacterium]|nr:DUF2914 domain-containing protein [Deltaproteobacteria bacterium]